MKAEESVKQKGKNIIYGCTGEDCKDFETKQKRTLQSHVLLKHKEAGEAEFIVKKTYIEQFKVGKNTYKAGDRISSKFLFDHIRAYKRHKKSPKQTGQNTEMEETVALQQEESKGPIP